jgi:hypothetical protein
LNTEQIQPFLLIIEELVEINTVGILEKKALVHLKSTDS